MSAVPSEASPTQLLAELVALMRSIDSRLETLPADLAAAVRGAPRSLRPADELILASLLPFLLGDETDHLFLAAEAVAQLAKDATASSTAAAALGNDAKNAAKRLGRLLRRADGCTCGGLHVQRVGETRSGILWRVMRVSR